MEEALQEEICFRTKCASREGVVGEEMCWIGTLLEKKSSKKRCLTEFQISQEAECWCIGNLFKS